MKKLSSFILLFAVILTAFALTACNKKKVEKTLVVGYDDFSAKFSPFFSDTVMDTDVVDLVSVDLMTTDRDGGIIYNSIEGEPVTRGDKSYTYTGISNIDVDYDETEGITTYSIEIRDDIKFSDGHVMDADDIIFSYYVLLDPAYYGSSSLSAIDIVGYQNYVFNSTASEQAKQIAEGNYQDLIDAIGTDTANAELDQYVVDEIHNLIDEEYYWVKNDVITNEGYSGYWRVEDGSAWDENTHSPEDASATATLAYFYSLDENYSVVGKTVDQVVNDIAVMYEYDYELVDSYYGAAVVAPKVEKKALYIAIDEALETLQGQPVPNITGIKKINQTKVEIKVYGFDAAAVYDICGITVAPLHYYGDLSLYDYNNNKFGFHNREDNAMELIEEKTATPLGAGPYVFKEYKNNVVSFTANKHYYKGEPKIKYINFQVVDEGNKISAIATGEIDISNPSGSRTKFIEIRSHGDKIALSSIDNLGYGYIGINANTVNVDGDIDSNASKALRKGFATVLSALRYTSINSYYGEAAQIINYPISNTSWAAPKAGETGYEVAYSKNPNGSNIYGNSNPAELPDSERSEKAKLAAKAWLEEAGYTFTQISGSAQFGDYLYDATAPTGAKLEYEIIVPGDGDGDHPSFAITTDFKNIMEELGITININDPADSNILWDKLDAGTAEMWCAAWGTTIDPDMYQIYHSNNVVGEPNSTNSNHYYIRDNQLDDKIMEARTSDDQSFRKARYKECLDIILDWGVEVPVYQRQNIMAFSTERVNIDTLTPDITTYWDWTEDIEKLEMK